MLKLFKRCKKNTKNKSVIKAAIPLKRKHVKNCKVIEDRAKLLKFLPKNSICAELGILHCNYSEKILTITKPKKLHLIDCNNRYIKEAERKFRDIISDGRVELHLGNSYDILRTFPDKYFDWVYIDANHLYSFVKKDLEIAHLKIKNKGLIFCHDYTFYDHILNLYYGVIPAVNEFCNKYNYEIIYFVIDFEGFNSVVLRKI